MQITASVLKVKIDNSGTSITYYLHTHIYTFIEAPPRGAFQPQCEKKQTDYYTVSIKKR